MSTSPMPKEQALLMAGRGAAGMKQTEWGDLLGVSARTVIRLENGQGATTPMMLYQAARAVYPFNRELAARIAEAGSSSVVALGLEDESAPVHAPPPSEPVLIASEPASLPALKPAMHHLVDSVICAAAESMGQPPQALRPALFAACARAREIGLTLEDLEQSLMPDLDERGGFVPRR